MRKVIRCPVCDSANEGHRTQCSCGFRLTAKKEEVLAVLRGRAQAQAMVMIGGLALLAVSGGFSMAMLYRAETEGRGPVVIFYGLMFAGVSLIVRGYFGWQNARSRVRRSEGGGD
jgi:hypothetical protein